MQVSRGRFADQLPSRPGQLRRRTVEYVRHGTRCITAGLFLHTGVIIGMVTRRCSTTSHSPRRSHRSLVGCPSGSTDDLLPALSCELAQSNRALVQHTPAPLFAIGDLPSGDDLAAKILTFIDTYNCRHAHPQWWTNTGEPLAA